MFIKIFKFKFLWYIFNYKNNKNGRKKIRLKLILKNYIYLMYFSMFYNYLCIFNV